MTDNDLLKCSRFISSRAGLMKLATALSVTAEVVRKIETDYQNPDVGMCAYQVMLKWLNDGTGQKSKSSFQEKLYILEFTDAAERYTIVSD